MPAEHEPVLATELIDLLDPQPGETFVDCTFGGGGHARLIAERLGPEGELIAVDRDPAAEERWREFAADAPCRTPLPPRRLRRGPRGPARRGRAPDGHRLSDLGMSSMQVDAWERGFSYSYDAPLDMRMDPDAEPLGRDGRQRVAAGPARAARSASYGEERRAGSIAREIVRSAARSRPRPSWSPRSRPRSRRPSASARGHPAKRTFQAIRIAVNGELDALDRALPLAWDLLGVGGRLGAISFHSLEDRRVKRFLADRARGCVCPPELPVCVCGREPEAELLTKRAIAPGAEELERNPRAGSAHLRAALKIREEEAD